MPAPVSSTEDMARLARLCGAVALVGDEDEITAEAIIRTLTEFGSDPATIAAALAALRPPKRFNPDVPCLDLTDEELDQLAFAEAMEHVFRGRPSAIVGPIPR